MRKTLPLLVLFLCNIVFANAQFYKTLRRDDSFSDSLGRIVYDFKNNFYPIQGRQLTSEGTVDVFESTISMPGSANCVIQRYHSDEDTSASWQAIMYEGDSYAEATKIYKNTFKQLKKAKLKFDDNRVASFTGDIELPNESVRFTVTTLRLNIMDRDYKNFYAVVEISNNFAGWEVHLNLYNKKNDGEQY